MAGQIEQAAIVERPAFAGRGHQIPAMHVADVEVAGDVDFRKRPGQLGVGEYIAVDAEVAAVEQAREFGNRGSIQMNAHAQLVLAIRAGLQQAARGEFAEALRCLVGARGCTGKTDHHIAIFVGIDIHVGVADVKDGLGVAELEVDASAADLNVGDGVAVRDPGCGMTIEQRLNVPGTRRHLHHVDAGRIQTETGEFETAGK